MADRGPMFNDENLLVAAAIEGIGVLYILEDLVAGPMADGDLARLLEPWCEPFADYHLYDSNREGTALSKGSNRLFDKQALLRAWPFIGGASRARPSRDLRRYRHPVRGAYGGVAPLLWLHIPPPCDSGYRLQNRPPPH